MEPKLIHTMDSKQYRCYANAVMIHDAYFLRKERKLPRLVRLLNWVLKPTGYRLTRV